MVSDLNQNYYRMAWLISAIFVAFLGYLPLAESSHKSHHRHTKLKSALCKFNMKLHIDQSLAEQWFSETEETLRLIRHDLALAEWNFETNVSNSTEQEIVRVSLSASNYSKVIATKAKKLQSRFLPGSETRRRLELLGQFYDPLDATVLRKLQERHNELMQIYAEASIEKDGKRYRMEPELTNLMKTNKDPKVLEWAWKGWRDATGKKMKNLYAEFVDLLNTGAKENGFTDYGQAWRDQQFEDTPELMAMSAKLWSELSKMYQKVHAFVRTRLKKYYIKHYPDFKFPADGTIPAHLLGNMWSQEFQAIYEIVKPFPNIPEPDAEESMKNQGYDVQKLFKMAEDFYTSLGLDPMTETFWERSMTVRPSDREVQCHASAYDFFTNEPDPKKDDFRIKMCTEVDLSYFEIIHHEMGHIQYFMEYRNQPVEYRDSANQAFHEAIGDTISLSVMSNKHLRTVGLLPNTKTIEEKDLNAKRTINFLMKQALFKIAFLPYGYLIDMWRFGVFDGTIKKEEYNREYWKLRLQYQGLSPPVERTEDDFDPGAKFHIPSNAPYISYFISFISQFQFYESLCKESGHTGPLHQCDYYRSMEAGSKLKSFLKLGKSKHWKDALRVLTGSSEIKTDSIRRYFRPLTDWLDREGNADTTVGWKGVKQ